MMNKNKAKILREITYSDTPVTFQLLCDVFAGEIPRTVIWDNLQILIHKDKAIEEKNFRDEGINPRDYKLADRGRLPRVFYRETDRGVAKLERLEERNAFAEETEK